MPKIVIEISNEELEKNKRGESLYPDLRRAILNGIPLSDYNEIGVGDEVTETDLELTFVITRRFKDEFEGVCSDGSCYQKLNLKNLKKTGRHFNQIKEVLQQMQKEVEDDRE